MARVYFNGELIDERSFTWDAPDANYIGFSSRASNSVTMDLLRIKNHDEIPTTAADRNVFLYF